MILSNNNAELRIALRLDGLLNTEHRLKIESLKSVHNHTIQFLTDGPQDATCAPYALDIRMIKPAMT